LPVGFVAEVSVERGIATVVLPATFITDIPGGEQRLAVAQIVLTLTRQSGVGQVRFTSNNEPQSVPRGRGDLSAPGASVACDDYANLLPSNFSC
jgi:spore germination protein GerM